MPKIVKPALHTRKVGDLREPSGDSIGPEWTFVA